MTAMHTATVYKWDDLQADLPMALITRRRIDGEKMTLARMVLEPSFRVPSHQHENEQMAVILSGKITFGIGVEGSGEYEEHTLVGGQVMHLPSMVWHSAEAIEETHILDIFSPPAEAMGIDQHAD